MFLLLVACSASTPPSDDPSNDSGSAPCSSGLEVGECPPDVTLVGTDGAPASLLSFSGEATLIASEAGWCSSCQDLVTGLQELYAARQADGLVIVDVLVEGVNFEPADADDAAEWTEYFELTYPVLADPEGVFLPAYGGDISSAPFVFYVLDSEGAISWRLLQEDGHTLDEITAAVEDVLGE